MLSGRAQRVSSASRRLRLVSYMPLARILFATLSPSGGAPRHRTRPNTVSSSTSYFRCAPRDDARHVRVYDMSNWPLSLVLSFWLTITMVFRVARYASFLGQFGILATGNRGHGLCDARVCQQQNEWTRERNARAGCRACRGSIRQELTTNRARKKTPRGPG